MTGPDGCFTLAVPGRDEILVRRSRFIGIASPAKSEDEALETIRSVKSEYRDASHHCYAYIIGENAGLMRYSDDREPQGTAGLPILEVLKGKRLVNCAVVVTRYFGGVLLGTGRLSRAYSLAASQAVKSASVALSLRSVRVRARIPYAFWDKVHHALDRLTVCDVTREFSSLVALSFTARERDVDALHKELAALTDGNAALECSEPFYWLWEAGQEGSLL